MEDIREYEKRLHDETNKIVGCSAEPAEAAASAEATAAMPAAAAGAGDDESPGTPSNTPTEKSVPFQFPDTGETPASFQWCDRQC